MRLLFVSLLLTLLAYSGLDAALTHVADEAATGVASCGTAADPCALTPLTVQAPQAGHSLVQVERAPAQEPRAKS
ncbi:MAG TPA: hypothetical protein VEW03_14750 [Longimicrobiaceae bacterium]|nr:hypothetical protein [Longimicrobiaceae bacterium]